MNSALALTAFVVVAVPRPIEWSTHGGWTHAAKAESVTICGFDEPPAVTVVHDVFVRPCGFGSEASFSGLWKKLDDFGIVEAGLCQGECLQEGR